MWGKYTQNKHVVVCEYFTVFTHNYDNIWMLDLLRENESAFKMNNKLIDVLNRGKSFGLLTYSKC